MSEFDASEFVDKDFQGARKSAKSSSSQAMSPFTEGAGPAPTREEVESKVSDLQQKLADLKRTQQELERERALLEETRRRQSEFTTGRDEMVQHLTRGVGLLEGLEFAARRDAEQMAKALVGLRESLLKIQTIQEEAWTRENLNMELSRATTAVENARMEWNAARLKFPVLSGSSPAEEATPLEPQSPSLNLLQEKGYAELCKLGLALTWPLVLAAVAIFLVLLLR